MGRRVTPLALVALAGCRQILGIGDTEVVSDAPTSRPDGPRADADPTAPDAPPDAPPGSPDAAASLCPVSYDHVSGGHRYRVATTATSWAAAADTCHGDGGGTATTYLAVPDGDPENAAIAALIADPAWIGVTDAVSEGTFRNVLGAVQAFLPWEPGEPDGGAQDCVAVEPAASSLAGQWFDEHCSGALRYVCECES